MGSASRPGPCCCWRFSAPWAVANVFVNASAPPGREGFASTIRHHAALTSALEIEQKRPPPASAFRTFCPQQDVVPLSEAIAERTIAQIPRGTEDLAQLICDGTTMCGVIEPISSGGSAQVLPPTTLIAQVTLDASALGMTMDSASPDPKSILGEAPDPSSCSGSGDRAWP